MAARGRFFSVMYDAYSIYFRIYLFFNCARQFYCQSNSKGTRGEWDLENEKKIIKRRHQLGRRKMKWPITGANEWRKRQTPKSRWKLAIENVSVAWRIFCADLFEKCCDVDIHFPWYVHLATEMNCIFETFRT